MHKFFDKGLTNNLEKNAVLLKVLCLVHIVSSPLPFLKRDKTFPKWVIWGIQKRLKIGRVAKKTGLVVNRGMRNSGKGKYQKKLIYKKNIKNVYSKI